MTTTAVPAGMRGARAGRDAAVAGLALLPVAFLVGLVACVVQVGERPELVAGTGWPAGRVDEVLAGWGFPVGWYVGWWAFIELAVVAASVVASAVILRGPRSAFRIYLAGVLLLHATAGGAVLPVLGVLHPWVEPAGATLQGLAWFALFPLAYVFPDGRFVPRWTRWLLVGWLALFAVLLLGPPEPPAAPWLTLPMLLLLASALGAQVHRYLRVSGAVQRQQVKWVVFAVALRFAYMVAILATPLGPLMNEHSSRGLAANTVLTTVSYAISALLPVTIAIAVVRHRLFDIDVVISRTLVYGTLTAFVAGAYAAVVVGAGAMWRDGGVALAVVAAAVVALAVSPLRSWLQKRVNRLVYGQRDDPYAVVSDLGRRLADAVPSDAVLRTIVDTIGTALKVPHVSLAVDGGSAAVFGSPGGGRPAEFPLEFHGARIGVLTVTPAPGDQLGAADRALLADVGRQAGVAVRAASLTADLRAARERTVAAREEERRRLHRDLHDGLGPTLASLYQRVDAAAGLVVRDPESAAARLGEVSGQIKAAIGDIRALVYALRPPALDELGIVGAVEEAGRRLGGVSFTVTGTLPPLPAVVEVAAYRIAVEAMTNAVRHAGASSCEVRFAAGPPYLLVDVTDDGGGLPADLVPGGGLRSMRERAEEIGGTLTVGPGPRGGVHVGARLPLTVDESWQ